MIVLLYGTGSPTHQTIEPNTRAKTRFMAGPARATAIFFAGDAAGRLGSHPPSIASDVIICGSFTNPPKGSQRRAHSTPERSFHPKIFGPNPIENPSTLKPRRRATQKWPYSWTKTANVKSAATPIAMMTQDNSADMRWPT